MELMQDWYERYYTALEGSNAYATFCERVFGQNLGQHGFADVEQLRHVRDALLIAGDERVVDFGCGSGGITSYVASQTNACGVGVDFIQRAVQSAQAQYGTPQLHFVVSDIGRSCLGTGCADVLINIDAVYFHPLPQIVSEMKRLLAPGGRMGILYTLRADGPPPYDGFDRHQLTADSTPLALELHTQGLEYAVRDLTHEDYAHAERKREVLDDLHDEFVAEGNEFLYDNRYGEALGALRTISDNVHVRYQYIAARAEDGL